MIIISSCLPLTLTLINERSLMIDIVSTVTSKPDGERPVNMYRPDFLSCRFRLISSCLNTRDIILGRRLISMSASQLVLCIPAFCGGRTGSVCDGGTLNSLSPEHPSRPMAKTIMVIDL